MNKPIKPIMEQNHTEPDGGARANVAPDEVDELRGEIERLKVEKERLDSELQRKHEIYIRNLADFDNYCRRAERERAQAAQDARRELALPLLEVMDDLERAIDRTNDYPQVAARFRAIYDRLAVLLAAQGVAVKATA